MDQVLKQFSFIASAVLLAIIFRNMPIDIYVSSWFFNPTLGFAHGYDPLLWCIYYLAYLIMALTVAIPSLFVVADTIRNHSISFRRNIKCLYIITVCIIGPLLLVNLVCKNLVFHRPRPRQVQVFNGPMLYTPPWQMQGECSGNCSFVSGHASAGFALYSLAFVQTTRRSKSSYILIATVLGSIIGLTRIAQGGHFLSDVVFAGIINFAVAYLLAKLYRLNPK